MTASVTRSRGEKFAGREFEAASLALVALTMVTALAMTRLFDKPSFLGPVLAAALAAHGTAFAARQARLPTAVAVSAPFVAVATVPRCFPWLSPRPPSS